MTLDKLNSLDDAQQSSVHIEYENDDPLSHAKQESLLGDDYIIGQGSLFDGIGEQESTEKQNEVKLVYVDVQKRSLKDKFNDVLAPSENLQDSLLSPSNEDIYAPVEPAFKFDDTTHICHSIYDEIPSDQEHSGLNLEEDDLEHSKDTAKTKAKVKTKAKSKPKIIYEPYVYPIDPKVYAVCGIDEAGRGPLMGDVVASCVILDHNHMIAGLNDSKQLSEKARDALALVIKEQALSYGIGRASPQEIDELNILNATFLAMRRAFDAMNKQCNLALIDGNKVPKTFKDIPMVMEAVVKGDARVAEISAASILAKTARDADCYELDKLHPEYGFAKHKGYPTKAHLDVLATLPILPCYRLSYGPVKKLLEQREGQDHNLTPKVAQRYYELVEKKNKQKDELLREYTLISIDDLN